LITLKTYLNKNNSYKGKITNYAKKLIYSIIKVIYLPLVIVIKASEFVNKYLDSTLKEKIKMKKIRPGRYINKSSCRIEEYSYTRALAYVK
jgi:hypothetical protein